MPTIDDLVANKQIIAVVCNQWGDTGKGKFSDLLAAQWADVIARGTGGNNAGHTTVVHGKQRIFHLIPAGIIYDAQGKVNILGNGMVIDLAVLCSELDALDSEGTSYNHLMISQDAAVILPWHVEEDQRKYASQAGGGIGTTGRGIGPCYGDKVLRRGIFMCDLYNKDRLAKKLEKLKSVYPKGCSVNDVMAYVERYAPRLRQFIRDTVTEMHNFVRQGKKVLLEGAQGLLLSIEHGTYPFVTSSDCSVNGTATGVGLPARAIDLALGIVKFPYMTRVGGGPFPTELCGETAEHYCAQTNPDGTPTHSLRAELKEWGIPFTESEGRISYDHHAEPIRALMNSPNPFHWNYPDPFYCGIGIRLAGGEYGATTGRPRRIGWTDLAALRYAIGINGPDVILTKPDVMQTSNIFCLADYERFQRDEAGFGRMLPPRLQLISFNGFNEDISGCRSYDALPDGLKQAVNTVRRCGANVRMISVGPEPQQTIVV